MRQLLKKVKMAKFTALFLTPSLICVMFMLFVIAFIRYSISSFIGGFKEIVDAAVKAGEAVDAAKDKGKEVFEAVEMRMAENKEGKEKIYSLKVLGNLLTAYPQFFYQVKNKSVLTE